MEELVKATAISEAAKAEEEELQLEISTGDIIEPLTATTHDSVDVSLIEDEVFITVAVGEETATPDEETAMAESGETGESGSHFADEDLPTSGEEDPNPTDA